jgi:RNA polymerase sigma factor (sigma-70 family)
MQRTDEQLLTACRRGEEDAWEALVKSYQRLIYAIPRRAGLDEDLASEVFQEVFATLLQSIDSIEQPSRLHAWLVTTARRKTWRLISREGGARRGHDPGDDEGADPLGAIPDQSPLPDAVLVQLEEQHRVRTALEELDERCQSLLRMLFYEPEPPPYSEIAARLGTTEGSIGPTRARCLQKLLRALEKG